MKITSLLVVPVLASALLAGAPLTPNVQFTRIYLTRPVAGAPDLDARGALVIRSYDGGDRERWDIKASKLVPGMDAQLYVEDAGEQMVLVGTLQGGATKHYSLDTAKGDVMPLGGTLADLVGREVEVRVAGVVLLHTAVPAFVDTAVHESGKEFLDVAAGSPNQGCQGVVWVKAHDKNGLQFLRLKAKDLGWQSFDYTLWVEDDKGQMVEIGPVDQYAKRKGRFDANTRSGKPLPLGVFYVESLVGRKLEVRDQNGVVYLEEVIPPLTAD